MKFNIALILTIPTIAILTSCVPKSDYDQLQKENSRLREEVESLRAEKSEREEKERLDNLRQHSEDEALKLLKDYYEFYNANFVYRRPKIRRLSNNRFVISLEECIKEFRDIEFHWHSKVVNLTINSDGTYNIN